MNGPEERAYDITVLLDGRVRIVGGVDRCWAEQGLTVRRQSLTSLAPADSPRMAP